MPPTPLVDGWRVTFKYTVDLMQHRCQMYCDTVVSGDSTGYDLVARGGFSNPGFSTIGNAFFNAIVDFYNAANCSFDSAILEEFLSPVGWVVRATTVPSVSPTGAGTPKQAMMKAIPGKAGDNTNLPWYIYETDEISISKLTGYSGLSSRNKRLVDYMWNSGGVATDPMAFAWRLSRGGSYPQRWLSMVNDSNEKLRRLRGLK
jgi:hypothetical protein